MLRLMTEWAQEEIACISEYCFFYMVSYFFLVSFPMQIQIQNTYTVWMHTERECILPVHLHQQFLQMKTLNSQTTLSYKTSNSIIKAANFDTKSISQKIQMCKHKQSNKKIIIFSEP